MKIIKNRTKNFLLVLSISILVFSIQVRAFDEQDVIYRVLSKHENFVSSEIDMLIQQKRLQNKYKDYYGWDLDLTAKRGIKKKSTNKDTQSTRAYTKQQDRVIRDVGLKLSTAFQNGSSFSVGFSRKLPTDGQEQYKKDVYYKDVHLSEQNNVITTAINIPLLQNADGGENKKLYDVAILDKKIEVLNLLKDKESKVADALGSFIELAVTIQRVKTYQQHLDELIQLQKIALNKKDNSIIQAKIKKIKIGLSKVKANLGSAILTLKSFIDFDENDLSTVDFNDKKRIVLLKSIDQYLRQNNRDLQIDKLDIAKKQRYIERYKNKKLVDLDLNLTDIKTQNRGTYSSYSYLNSDEYEISLVLTYPLGGSASNRQSLLTAILEKKKKLIDYKDSLKKTVLDVKVLENSLKSGNDTLKSYQLQIKQGKSIQERKRYLANSGNIRFVIDELGEYYAIKVDYLDEVETHHKTRIEYEDTIDRLLASNQQAQVCYFCQQYNNKK